MKKYLIITALIFTTSCVNQVDRVALLNMPTDQYATQVEVKNDGFEQEIEYQSIILRNILDGEQKAAEWAYRLSGDIPFHDNLQYALRSFKNKETGKLTHQLYVSITYFGSWRFYNRASDSNAKRFDVNTIAREVIKCSHGSCHYSEDIAVALPDHYLKSHTDKPIRIKINSKSSKNNIIELPANYIKAHLAGIK